MVSTKKNKLASLRDPNTLKSGHVKKLSSGTAYVVKRNSEGVARYVKARPDDVKCSKTLKKNVSEMLNEVKKNKNKQSYSQALAIAYSKTQKKYPKCQLVQKTNNKTKKLTKSKHIQNGGDINSKHLKLQRKIIKLLIKRNYIRKQPPPQQTLFVRCQPVKGDSIKSLYDNFKVAPDVIRNIKYKTNAYTLTELLNIINQLIANCVPKHTTSLYTYTNPAVYSQPNILSTSITGKYFKYMNNSIMHTTEIPNKYKPDDPKYEVYKLTKLYKFIKKELKLLSI